MSNNRIVSVIFDPRYPAQCLLDAINSVLNHSECLEILLADYGDYSVELTKLRHRSYFDSRIRIIDARGKKHANTVNKLLMAARGTLIGWLNAGDIYTPGALSRFVSAFNLHPDWLMVIGDGKEFIDDNKLVRRYPVLPFSGDPSRIQIDRLVYQIPVVFKRTMRILLGEFSVQWQEAFDLHYWLRAVETFPGRIGYLPHVQGRSIASASDISSLDRLNFALDATEILAFFYGESSFIFLHSYALQLQLGVARLRDGSTIKNHLQGVFQHAKSFLSEDAYEFLMQTWFFVQPLDIFGACSREVNSLLHKAIPNSSNSFLQRPFGVNLIGHAFEVFGIGEDLRMAARAMESVGIPCCVIHHPARNGSNCTDRSIENLICSASEGGPFAFNIICLAAPIFARWLNETGCEPLRGRYTIVCWPWETQQWPDAWMPLLDVVDEFWPSSQFTASALAGPVSETRKPLHVMPMAAEINDPGLFSNASARETTRRRYNLQTKSVLFGFGFDLNSTATRKNPMGSLEAFQQAFPLPNLPDTYGRESKSHPLSKQVTLMIKTFPPKCFSAEWEWLQSRAQEDSRIVLIEESMSRDELLLLYGCCDVFLSLHRSEGFGRGMAEALQLGVDVIATDFGGNTDFCKGPLAHPVRYRLTPISRSSYPFADGHLWAEPDLEHAAVLCRQVAARRLADAEQHSFDISRNEFVLAEYRKQFSFEVAGERYLSRLRAIWNAP